MDPGAARTATDGGGDASAGDSGPATRAPDASDPFEPDGAVLDGGDLSDAAATDAAGLPHDSSVDDGGGGDPRFPPVDCTAGPVSDAGVVGLWTFQVRLFRGGDAAFPGEARSFGPGADLVVTGEALNVPATQPPLCGLPRSIAIRGAAFLHVRDPTWPGADLPEGTVEFAFRMNRSGGFRPLLSDARREPGAGDLVVTLTPTTTSSPSSRPRAVR